MGPSRSNSEPGQCRGCALHAVQVRGGFKSHLAFASGAQASQAGTDFADQDIGPFEGGVVSALVGLAAVDQVVAGVFDPASGQARDVAG